MKRPPPRSLEHASIQAAVTTDLKACAECCAQFHCVPFLYKENDLVKRTHFLVEMIEQLLDEHRLHILVALIGEDAEDLSIPIVRLSDSASTDLSVRSERENSKSS